jgi:hypothetical protein
VLFSLPRSLLQPAALLLPCDGLLLGSLWLGLGVRLLLGTLVLGLLRALGLRLLDPLLLLPSGLSAALLRRIQRLLHPLLLLGPRLLDLLLPRWLSRLFAALLRLLRLRLWGG